MESIVFRYRTYKPPLKKILENKDEKRNKSYSNSDKSDKKEVSGSDFKLKPDELPKNQT